MNIRRKWTKEELDFIKNNCDKMNSVEMSSHLDRTIEAIRKKRKSLGIEGKGNESSIRYNYNNDFFESIDSENKAYWLGFIASDGCITDKGNGGKRLKITLKLDDKEHLQKFADDLDSNLLVKEKVNKIKGKEYPTSEIVVNSTKICNDIINLGIDELKTTHLEMPDIRHDMIKHFLRGFIDGDGCIYFKKYEKRYRYAIEIVGYECRMMYDIDDYLKSIGINSHIYQKRKNNLKLMISEKASIDKLIQHVYVGSNVYLDRKYQKAIELLNTNTSRRSA